jgi:hypothetical protein
MQLLLISWLSAFNEYGTLVCGSSSSERARCLRAG